MKVGILGSGDVGHALAKGFKAEGHEVMIATRDPASDKAEDLRSELSGITVSDFKSTAEFAEVVVLCTLWSGTENALGLADCENLKDKIVIDATNPLEFSIDGPKLAIGHTDSGGEQIQRWLSKSKVVKAFNSVGNARMYKPDFQEGTPTMFICGDDDDAKQQVTDILTSFGWETVDIGDITGARELEPLCMLWVKYGTHNDSWDHAFKLLRK